MIFYISCSCLYSIQSDTCKRIQRLSGVFCIVALSMIEKASVKMGTIYQTSVGKLVSSVRPDKGKNLR